MSRFNASYQGIGELLRSEGVRAEMVRRAEKVKALADATAPDARPYGVGYKYQFRIDSGIKTSSEGTRRAFARVINDSQHAIFVEYGGQNTPAHRTLGRALRAAGD